MSNYRGYSSGYETRAHEFQLIESRNREREFRESQLQQEIGSDPNEFRRYFNHHLQLLNFNSKEIINNLTLLATNHKHRMSSIVAQCIEDHLRSCPAQYTLPCLYLLDSISKNIGPPYPLLFARFIERSFLAIYQEMDSNTKIKMEELLGTWRTGGREGQELFLLPEEVGRGRVQSGIEGVLFGFGGRGGGVGNGGRGVMDADSFNSGVQQISVATPVERAEVLFDVRRLLSVRREQATLDPLDSINNSQIQALTQLESLVLSAQVTTVQVTQIRTQLTTLIASIPPTPLPAPILPPSPIAPLLELPPPPPVNPINALAGIDLNLLAQLTSTGTFSNLFQSVETEKDSQLIEKWNSDILSLNLKLQNSSLLQNKDLTQFLFERLSLQCKQCGLRNFNSVEGQGFMDEHLDWHFHFKRKIREGGNRAQGRSWFSGVEEWIKADEMDYTPKLVEKGIGLSQVEKMDLEKKKVRVVNSKLEVGCIICKEVLKSEFAEEEEDWVYFNAVEIGDQISHATCQAELALTKKAKLKIDSIDSTKTSRESTPLISALKKVMLKEESPLPSSERKRKAEGEEEMILEEGKKARLEGEVIIKVEKESLG